MSVVVVGGGPAGLACALELRRRGVPDVVVLDREARAGGVPRHCGHQGFGLRDLRRVLSGPAYARRYVELVRRAGADVIEEAMVTGWSADGALAVTTASGRETLRPGAVVLATGCRERPRAARLVPGSRPEGVLTTGQLQQLVERGLPVGRRAVVVGAEHVSYSAVLTLVHAGVEVVGLTTELPRHQTVPVLHAAARLRYRMPVWTRTAVSAVHGRDRVEEVELTGLDHGTIRNVACDTVVFTADWVPDHELAIMGGIDLGLVDTGLRTARTGVFAAGNLIHAAEPADVAALGGRRAAASLAGGGDWPASRVPIVCAEPLLWISPGAVSTARDRPPRERFLLRAGAFVERAPVQIRQEGRVLWQGGVDLTPGRSSSLPADWIEAVDPGGLTVTVATI
jgi:thioredoxin reductase